MVAQIEKLTDSGLYTERQAPFAGKWRNPAGLLYLTDGAAVSDEDFVALWRGFAPQNAGPLTRRAISGAHSPGFDILLSPDKSISALWAISPDFDRERIERAVMDAARISVTGTIFRYCAATRVGTTTTSLRVGTGDILAAVFPHHVSRQGHPQLDISCAVFNLVRTHSDRRFRTLHGYPLYAWRNAIGATFRNRLAHRLHRRLGIGLERHGRHGEFTRVRHMDLRLEEAWSKRRLKKLATRRDIRERRRLVYPRLFEGVDLSNAPLSARQTVTEGDLARFRDEASMFVDPETLHTRIVRSVSSDATEQECERVRREIDDIPRTLAESDLVFNTADIVTRVENAAGGLFDDTAMEEWLDYAFAAHTLLPLDYDDPNPDAVAGMAHKRMFTTRAVLDEHAGHKRFSGLTVPKADRGASKEPSRW